MNRMLSQLSYAAKCLTRTGINYYTRRRQRLSSVSSKNEKFQNREAEGETRCRWQVPQAGSPDTVE